MKMARQDAPSGAKAAEGRPNYRQAAPPELTFLVDAVSDCRARQQTLACGNGYERTGYEM